MRILQRFEKQPTPDFPYEILTENILISDQLSHNLKGSKLEYSGIETSTAKRENHTMLNCDKDYVPVLRGAFGLL